MVDASYLPLGLPLVFFVAHYLPDLGLVFVFTSCLFRSLAGEAYLPAAACARSPKKKALNPKPFS